MHAKRFRAVGATFLGGLIVGAEASAKPLPVGRSEENAEAVDRISLIIHFGQFFVIVAMVAFLVGFIWRHNRIRCKERDDLLEELEQEEMAENSPSKPRESESSQESESWEKDADWWKEDEA